MEETPFPSPEELREKYAYLLNNEALMNFACWSETNTDEPFDPAMVLRNVAANVVEDVRITKALLDSICQQS